MRKPFIRTMGTCLLAGSLALSFSATASEGLYSAGSIISANVYDSTGEPVGSVVDVLLGSDMSVHALVISTGEFLKLDRREIVAERGTFTLQVQESEAGFKNVGYEVHIDAEEEQVKTFPEYDAGWRNRTRKQLAQAWEETRETSVDAWQSTREATSSAWQRIREGAEKLRDGPDDEAKN